MRTGVTLAVLGVLVLGLAIFGTFGSRSQLAAVGDLASGNVTGWAWGADRIGSSNTLGGVGWISFSSANHYGSNPYGVNLDESSGRLSGEAWSDNLGWLSFDCALGGTCFATGESAFPGPGGSPAVNLTGGTADARPITGWARFCSVFESGCSGRLAESSKLGGWDGWVSLSGTSYGVTLKENDGVDASGLPKDSFQGYAWGGGDVVGWISFSGTGYGVIRGNQVLGARCSPDVNNAIVGITEVTWTGEAYGGTPPYTYTWTETPSDSSGPISPKRYTSTGAVSRTLKVTDNAGHGTTPEYIPCSGSVVVQENQPYYLLKASRQSVKLSNGTTGNSEIVKITVEPVVVGGDEFVSDVTLTGTLMNGNQVVSGADVTFSPDNIIKGPLSPSGSEYATGREMVLTVSAPGLTPGAPYRIRVQGMGGGIPASVYPDVGVNVEGTSTGFEEI